MAADPGSPRLARTPFVGRAGEIARLQERLAEVRSGQGGLVMLVGEPGIGKTRTAEEFAEYACGGGATVLGGRCYEGEWAPIIPELEDEDDWERHHKGVIESLKPEGYFEEVLVRRIATTHWELDRLTAYQVAATLRHIKGTANWMSISANYMSGTKEFVQPDPYLVRERQHSRLLPEADDLELIMRYGASLHRQWVQT